jgi:glycine C-acetyltransferase
MVKTMTTDNNQKDLFERRAGALLSGLESSGQLKHLQLIEGPMDATITLRGYGEVVCLCSNNYLGLANHPEVVEAGIEGLRKYGAGTAGVRFICGTFAPHERLERDIAAFYGVEAAYTFTSCWNANEAIFPTLCEPGDIVISDTLNHASIIDAIRLTTIIRKGVSKAVYLHNDLADLRSVMQTARQNPDVTGVIWVVTDGVFSMEGDIADLPGLRALCDEYGALLVVDDSHGTGVMGATGRGTHEHYGMPGSSVDFVTGTLGKALGGGAGGYIAGSRRGVDLLVQRGRPTLFSNALPATIACSAGKAIEIITREPQRIERLRDNVAYARAGIRAAIEDAGFEVPDSASAICPIIVHDTARAVAMSRRLLEMGVFVIGFGYPVVPEGEARLRIQISAAHEKRHLDKLFSCLKVLR